MGNIATMGNHLLVVHVFVKPSLDYASSLPYSTKRANYQKSGISGGFGGNWD